jgi:hypothetical protein
VRAEDERDVGWVVRAMSGPVSPNASHANEGLWDCLMGLPLCIAPSQYRGVMLEKLPADR